MIVGFLYSGSIFASSLQNYCFASRESIAAIRIRFRIHHLREGEKVSIIRSMDLGGLLVPSQAGDRVPSVTLALCERSVVMAADHLPA